MALTVGRRVGGLVLMRFSYSSPRITRYVAVALLLLLFGQLTTSAVVKSLTFDEPFHAAYGYVTLATGDWRMQENDEHPPLVSLLTGLTFWPLPNRPDPRQLPAWSNVPLDDLELIWELLHSFERSLEVLFFPPRVVAMGFALLLGAVLFRWASERHGSGGGLLALLVYAFSPNILAHGRLVTTDLPFTCCFFLAVYTYQKLIARPTSRRLMVAGLALGLALGTKVSALLLLPTFALLTLLRSRPEASVPRRFAISEWVHRLAFYVGWLTLTGLIAFLVLWMLYGFQVGPWGAGWPALPLPTYVKAALTVYTHGGHPAFLMGQISRNGWPRYFPVALLLKTPLPTLVGALVGTMWVLWRRRRWVLVTGILPPAAVFAAALFSSLNIGYRHILPVAPFLILMIAALAELPWQRKPLAVLGGGMALWLIIGTVRIHPDYLAYFNELAGGPSRGRWYLTDSNLDWGQDLIQLRGYLRDHAIDEVYLSYFGHPDPAEYGIHYIPLSQSFPWREEVIDFAPFAPAPGFYALSVTSLSGQYLDDPAMLDWFNHQTPMASVGHSINVYRVLPDESPPMWVSQCITPTVPLDDAAIAKGFGRTDLRRVDFDCTTTWLYPGSGAAEGVYAFHHDLFSEGSPRLFSSRWRDPTPLSPFIARHLAGARSLYEQRNPRMPSRFVLHERASTSPNMPQSSAVWVAPADTSPAALAGALPLTTPVSLDGPFTFLGALTYPNGTALEVETWWQVTKEPITHPFSIMAHLLTPDGEVLGVADGLGVLPLSLAIGDVVVQRHRWSMPIRDAPVWLRTGVYWLDTLERWRINAAQGADAIFLSPQAIK